MISTGDVGSRVEKVLMMLCCKGDWTGSEETGREENDLCAAYLSFWMHEIF